MKENLLMKTFTVKTKTIKCEFIPASGEFPHRTTVIEANGKTFIFAFLNVLE